MCLCIMAQDPLATWILLLLDEAVLQDKAAKMGKVDKILEALGQKLPSSAGRDTIVEALRAAARALPDSAAKTRKRLLEQEAELADVVEEKLLGRRTVEALSEEPPAQRVTSGPLAPHAVFAELADRPLAQRAIRCLSLIGLQSTVRCSAVLDAFVATLSSKEYVSAEDVQHCLRILPVISTLLDPGDKPPAWYSLMSFLLIAPTRMRKPDIDKQVEISEQIGGMITLCMDSLEVRVMLKDALTSLHTSCADNLAASLPGVLRVIRHGFASTMQGFEAPAKVSHDELVGTLLVLRFLAQCNHVKVGSAEALANLSESLLRSLADHRLDGKPQWHQGFDDFINAHVDVAEAAALKRKLARIGKRRLDSAEAVAEALAASLEAPVDAIIKLASTVCPSVAEEEDAKRAAAARAAGALFYEDTGKAVPSVNDLFFEDTMGESISSPAAGIFAKDAARVGIENMPGLQDLRSSNLPPHANFKTYFNQCEQHRFPESVPQNSREHFSPYRILPRPKGVPFQVLDCFYLLVCNRLLISSIEFSSC